MHRRRLLRAVPAAFLIASFPRFAASAEPGSFAALRDRYFLGVLRFNPVMSTYLGGDGYSPELADANGRLRDVRPSGIAAERAFYREIRAAHAGFKPASLEPQERIDHAVMDAQLAFLLHQLEELRYYERAVDSYVAEPFRGLDWQIQQMTDAGGGLLGTEGEWTLVARRLQAISAYVAAAQANLELGIASGNKADFRMVERDGVRGARSNAEYLSKTLPELAAKYLGGRPFAARMAAEIRRTGADGAQAYEGFAAFLERAYKGDRTDRFATGEKEYAWRVRNNLRDPRTPGQLFAYGKQQVALYQSKIYAVAQELATEAKLPVTFATPAEKNDAVRAVMDHLSTDSPKSDQEMLAWYVEAGKRAVAYGRERQLFDVPADYRLDVHPTPPVLQDSVDAAYYPAPPFKKSGVGRFYLSPTGDDPAALKLNNRASVATTAVHEGFPGHDWHFKFMTEHARSISNIRWLTPGAVEDSSSMWEDSMAAEGWGLYAEELMAEPAPGRPYGFYSAAEFMYQLQAQLMRAVRVVVDVGIHTGRMSYDQAVDYFAANVNFYPDARRLAASEPAAKAVFETSERAIYRYSKWPTQAITYNLGKAAIVQLREADRKKRSAAFSAKDFHERLMKMGTIPATFFRDVFLAS